MNAIVIETAPAPADDSADPFYSEAQDVLTLMGMIEYARAFDENARKDYAFCRRYARGDSEFAVSVNLLGTYIDIMVSFLYARDPDVDCMPAERIEATQTQDEAGGAPGAPAGIPGLPVPGTIGNDVGAVPGVPLGLAPPPVTAAPAPARDDDFATLKTYGKTMEIVIKRAWDDARLKRQAERWVRRSLTDAIGWLKSGWQEQYETPTVEDRIRDAQDNLAKIDAAMREIEAGEACDLEEKRRELQDRIEGLKGQSEKIISRGIFIDLVPGEDIQVSLDVENVVDCDSASWIAHRSFYPIDDLKARYKRIPTDKWSSISAYNAIKPLSRQERARTPETDGEIDATAADQYTTSAAGPAAGVTSAASKKNGGVFGCVWEMWNADRGLVYTMVEGVRMFALPPSPPNVPTTQWYPFFPLALHEVAGERHPQSLVMRSYRLADEYNRTRTAIQTLRARTKQMIAFDARNMSPEEVKKITGGTYTEWVPIEPQTEGGIQAAVWEVPYPKPDPALYDVQQLKNELEIIWGIQEALASGSLTPKTATEAEIQQAGTNARSGAMRDRIESVMTKMARYHAEITVQTYSLEDVRDIAGPGAIWIEGLNVQDLGVLLNTEIRAGSTGKPNTTRQRQQWAAEAPVIQSAVAQIGQLRGSSPMEIARCLEEIVTETVERAGDNMDVSRFIPRPGDPLQAILQRLSGGGAPGVPGAPGAPAPGGGPPLGAPAPQGSTVAPPDLPAQLQS